LDVRGELFDFVINDRCAAGTGRFLELAAQRLGLAVAELGDLAAQASETTHISSVCAVFAESEVVGLLAQGLERSTIARGLCDAVAQQFCALVGRLPKVASLAFVGGVAYNKGVRAALEQVLEGPVNVPSEPQLVVATGAAVLAARE
jgi:predicted CoA-substrate-specific enzyme activase